MTLLFVFAFVTLLITAMETTWPIRYRGSVQRTTPAKKVR